MSNSFTKLTYHCTWSTKGRVAALYEDMRPRLHAYIAQTINNDFGFAREVGGVDDHVHILCDLRPNVDISTFMGRVKPISSGWLHQEFPQLKDTNWQEGYGAFTVSASAIPSVKRYIQDQARHHEEMTFKEEFRRLLEKHDIAFDEKYLF